MIALDVPLPALATATPPKVDVAPEVEVAPGPPARGGTIRIDPTAAPAPPAPPTKVAKGTIRMDPTALPARLKKPPKTAASAIADEVLDRVVALYKALERRFDPRALKVAAIALPTLVVVALFATALYRSVSASTEDPSGAPQAPSGQRSEGPVVTPAGLVLPPAGRADMAGTSGSAAASAGGIDRSGKEGVGPGNLYLPASFQTKSGAFDVIVHAHGSPGVVVKSVELAGIDAAVVVMNMKKGSKYHEYFQDPGAFAALLEDVRKQAEKRGVADARVGRVALTSFSSGSGSVISILSGSKSVELVDAVLVLDGLQVRWANKRPGKVDPHEISPLLKFAHAAQEGDKLLVITHSGVASEDQANAGAVTDLLLEELGAERKPATEAPAPVSIDGAAGLFHDGKVINLEPGTTASAGGVQIRGYGNKTPGHQPAHLVQMSQTALPLLAQRWRSR